MSDSDLEEIKLDVDVYTARKTSPSCSSNSGRSWMGDTFRGMKQAKVVSLDEEANNKNTQQVTKQTSITGISQNNQRRLNSAPCQKVRQSSVKLLRNIASAKPKYFCSNSKYSTENVVHVKEGNICEKGSTIFDPISFHNVAGISSDKSGFLTLKKNLEPVCLKAAPSGDSCKNTIYDTHINNNKKYSAEISQTMFFPSLKTKDFINRDSNVPTDASSCFSSEESSNPFESSVFRENRFKFKRKKHSFTGKSGLSYQLHKSAPTEPEKNVSPTYKQRQYNTPTSNYYNTTDSYTIPFSVIHCGTQTDISFFTSMDSQMFEPVQNRSASNQWFMLHKATNTSNENCSTFQKSDDHLNVTGENFPHLRIYENNEASSKGSLHNNLHKNSHNNDTEKCDQKMNQSCCGNGCFSRLFSCCF